MSQFAAALIICILTTFTAGTDCHLPAYLPDDISISCGFSGTHTIRGSREWIGDADPKFTTFLEIKGSSRTSRGVDSVPYRTARISRSQFSYRFRLKPGRKLIRLHFNPTPYGKRFQDMFSVEAGNFILLGQFSASATANALVVKSFVKEFCVSVEENKKLEIVFSPESSQYSIDTFAFINGIEITSVPSHLSYLGGGMKVVGQNSLVYFDNSTAMEVIHRLHMKRDSARDDSRNVFGMWEAGDRKAGKEINNMTWNVSVDVGFSYLVRLHICSAGVKMAETDGTDFTVLIDGMIATSKAVVLKERDHIGIPWYEDHIVMIKWLKQQGTRDLSISLLLSSAMVHEYSPLKGFEIFKLSNAYNSLASPNPLSHTRDRPSPASHSLYVVFGQRNAVATIVITIVTLVNIVIHCLRKTREANPREEKRKPSARAARLCRRFSLAEIRAATRDFSSGLILGRGGFGVVYKGLIDNEQQMVAMKRLKRDSGQGKHEFWTEIEILSKLTHVNLVSLIGYCCEQQELVLVYEYMACGTLADHLYKLDMDSSNRLSWQQRLRICIGASRGLDYLHTGHGVIHRDVKTSNILLDAKHVAKIADFGLAKLHNITDQLQSHVSTNVKGTFGYLDPNYISTHKLTEKSDTYAFGVVLLEVLCGRPAMDTRADGDKHSITKWAQAIMSKGEVDLMVDSSLREEICPESLTVFMDIVKGCLQEEPKKRPTMAQVVLKLVSALEQQGSPSSRVPKKRASVSADAPPCNNFEAPIAGNSGTLKTSFRPKEKNSTGTANAEDPTGQKPEKFTARAHRTAPIWPLISIWNRVNFFKRKQFSDEEQSGYPTSDLRQQKHGKLFKHDDRPWELLYSGLAAATRNFSLQNMIGYGKFGIVYKGIQNDGREIAIKRRESDPWMKKIPRSQLEFLCQIPVHDNLCRLIGFCEERDEILLVHEYMVNHSLSDQLHGRENIEKNSSAINSWKTRIMVSLGAAQGIDYLHRAPAHHIIHGKFKSSNILLDKDWTAKVSNYGLTFMQVDDDGPFRSTIPLGSAAWFVAPEYVMQGAMTEKSDVYSLGVVLLELLTGKRAVIPGEDDDFRRSVRDAVAAVEAGNLSDILDPRVGPPDSNEIRALELMADAALICTRMVAEERPSMREVVLRLAGASAVLHDIISGIKI